MSSGGSSIQRWRRRPMATVFKQLVPISWDGAGPSVRPRRAAWVCVVLAAWAMLAAAPLGAQCVTDAQGPDDVPGQKDLSEFCFLGACTGGASTSWNFDDTQWTGNNT